MGPIFVFWLFVLSITYWLICLIFGGPFEPLNITLTVWQAPFHLRGERMTRQVPRKWVALGDHRISEHERSALLSEFNVTPLASAVLSGWCSLALSRSEPADCFVQGWMSSGACHCGASW